MIDTTARTIVSAQESSRDPHNDVDYVAGFESGDEEHPSYGACKPRSWNHGPEALAGDTVFLDMLEPSDQLDAVGSGTEAAEPRDLAEKKEVLCDIGQFYIAANKRRTYLYTSRTDWPYRKSRGYHSVGLA